MGGRIAGQPPSTGQALQISVVAAGGAGERLSAISRFARLTALNGRNALARTSPLSQVAAAFIR